MAKTYNQNFVPWELSALVPGLYTCIKLCNFWMSSLTPLKQFSPDITWDLLSKGYWQFVQMVLCHWTKRLPCPYVINILISSSLEPRKLWGWILVYSIGDSRSTNFIQMMVVGWPLTFLLQGQLCAPIHLYGENVEKSFSQWIIKTNGWNLQHMIKVVKLFSYCQNFLRFLPLPLGFIHV